MSIQYCNFSFLDLEKLRVSLSVLLHDFVLIIIFLFIIAFSYSSVCFLT